MLARREIDPAALRAAAWIARRVGRGGPPLRREDLVLLAAVLELRPVAPGQVVFTAGQPPKGVLIARSGLVELAVGASRRRGQPARAGTAGSRGGTRRRAMSRVGSPRAEGDPGGPPGTLWRYPTVDRAAGGAGGQGQREYGPYRAAEL